MSPQILGDDSVLHMAIGRNLCSRQHFKDLPNAKITSLPLEITVGRSVSIKLTLCDILDQLHKFVSFFLGSKIRIHAIATLSCLNLGDHLCNCLIHQRGEKQERAGEYSM